ncbi:hypothetical protein U732_101 [Clostridium argentinense CDC 2741]|uniref:Uncharacterized protein n=2 Tax=Clostridium argentinense TaxID=29341 RepID=A0A0C1U9Y1_9CLOT|nr:hypothetical protein [Clostridium argentinense]ARC83164.1 hypothetical protein RSJ17_00505 [Clostridium argentinense]KIE44410.1 hypothetical protein U732_101 [Clostridium argentinense CDC 2741]NFF41407.1 hypothetical protein [Clostridium argentinense]NFP52071.1 hypothetical protein [Clostridium argentinense]NFP74433.1 hypothetical protein [Clostridium argentinense]
MDDFIFEEQLKNVKSKKTRTYLSEVITTFYNKEYRSCIVVLYAITIVDLIGKIQILSEAYNDESSAKFLEGYKEDAKNNSKYSELERGIINFAVQIGIINDIEKKQWEQLKETRNYCAHPVVSNNFDLILPNGDQVRAHIRNMFEAIFLKDAILHKKLFDEFFNKISEYYERNNVNGIEEYVKNRYFLKLNLPTKKVFLKNMWKIAFHIQEVDCIKNRQAIYRSIIELINSDKSALLDFIEEEKTFFNSKIYFEDVIIEKDEKWIRFYDYSIFSLIYLLAEIPEIFKYISEDNKEEIKNLCSKNINLKLMAYYLYSSSKEHVESLKEDMHDIDYCIDTDVFNFVYEKTKNQGKGNYKSLAIYYHLNKLSSLCYFPDYSYINSNYKYMLEPILDDFSCNEIKDLINGITCSYKEAHCFKDFKNRISDIVERNNYDIDLSKLG